VIQIVGCCGEPPSWNISKLGLMLHPKINIVTLARQRVPDCKYITQETMTGKRVVDTSPFDDENGEVR